MSQYRKRVGYAKLGRSFTLDPFKTKTVGGDIDVCRLLHRMATENPDVEFVLIGRNQREDPQATGYPPNVTNPWLDWWGKVYFPNIPEFMEDQTRAQKIIDSFREVSQDEARNLDELVVWAGQHGSVNSVIPMADRDWNDNHPLATPQYSFSVYGGWLLDFINRWKEHDLANREEIWICADPRNYLKCRDLKWPLRWSILAQYEMTKQAKRERYGDWENLEGFPPYTRSGSQLVTRDKYVYSGLELTTLPRPQEIDPPSKPGKYEFGAIINEARKHVTVHRKGVLQDWILDKWPDCPLQGKWDNKSLAELKPIRKIVPVHPLMLFQNMRRYRTTLTTPSSGSGWATSKPWEAFAAGSICFFHPKYDDQGHIIPLKPDDTDDERLRELSSWLRVPDRETFWERAERVAGDEGLWRHLAQLQRSLFEDKFHEYDGGARYIKERAGLGTKTPQTVQGGDIFAPSES